MLVDEYLGYLADRNYSPRTLRAYDDLLAFCRWLAMRNSHVSAANLYMKCCATRGLSEKKAVARQPDYVLVAPSVGRKPRCGWFSVDETCFGGQPTAADRPCRPLVQPRPAASPPSP